MMRYTPQQRRAARASGGIGTLLAFAALTIFATSCDGGPTGANPRTAVVTFEAAGLPAGATSSVHIRGAASYDLTMHGSSTGRASVKQSLPPGQYTITVDPGSSEDDDFAAATIGSTFLPAGRVTPIPLPYRLATGRLNLVLSGVPAGAAGAVDLWNGITTRTVSASGLVKKLAPGTYTITLRDVVADSVLYRGTPTPATVDVKADTIGGSVDAVYRIASGSVALTATGLPSGTTASATLVGPDAVSHPISTRHTAYVLTPGPYVLTADAVIVGSDAYAPQPASQSLVVTASETPIAASVRYEKAQGDLTIVLAGLPAGVTGSVAITGPAGFSRTISASQVLSGLPVGTYTITPNRVSGAGGLYDAPKQTVTLAANSTATANVLYAGVANSLIVNISGLPAGTPARVTVTGPANYVRSLTAGDALTDLAPGTYTITPSGALTLSKGNFRGSPSTQSVTVGSAGTATASVVYSPSLNLSIARVYVTQSQQSADGSIPLVANRAALLRVLVSANESNAVRAAVRARIYANGSLVSTTTATGSGAVPVSPSDNSMGSAWTFPVPAGQVQPGLGIAVDVDPDSSLLETSRADNSWPGSTPFTPAIHAEPTLRVMMVPIAQSVNGTVGNVTASNAAAYVDLTKRVWPIGAVDVAMHATYTTSAPAVDGADVNTWATVLEEIYALRAAEGSSRNYYGVLHLTYTSGYDGLGYLGAPAAIGGDLYGPSTMAHELGHNFDRPHAPCGGAGDPDPSYPYPDAQIGMPGIDVANMQFYPSTAHDLMSYCSADWVSDYNYAAAMRWREQNVSAARVAHPDAERSGAQTGHRLLVWGRVGPTGLVLEPAFVVDAPAALPASDGPALLEGIAVDGRAVFSLRFAPARMAETRDSSFAFAVPMADADLANLAAIRLTVGGHSVTRAMHGETAMPAVQLARSGTRVRVRWDAASQPVLLVRDGATGQVLSFARGGDSEIAGDAAAVTVDAPDRPRTRGLLVVVPR